VLPNYAFERPGSPSSWARVRRVRQCAPATRLKRLRPAHTASRLFRRAARRRSTRALGVRLDLHYVVFTM
jgi:hypothetical protein